MTAATLPQAIPANQSGKFPIEWRKVTAGFGKNALASLESVTAPFLSMLPGSRGNIRRRRWGTREDKNQDRLPADSARNSSKLLRLWQRPLTTPGALVRGTGNANSLAHWRVFAWICVASAGGRQRANQSVYAKRRDSSAARNATTAGSLRATLSALNSGGSRGAIRIAGHRSRGATDCGCSAEAETKTETTGRGREAKAETETGSSTGPGCSSSIAGRNSRFNLRRTNHADRNRD